MSYIKTYKKQKLCLSFDSEQGYGPINKFYNEFMTCPEKGLYQQSSGLKVGSVFLSCILLALDITVNYIDGSLPLCHV